MPFWHARWAGDDPLRNRFPSLFASSSHKHIAVNKWLLRFASHQNLGFGPHLSPEGQSELQQLNTLIHSSALTTNSDGISWRWCSNRRFNAQSAYSFLIFDGVDDRRIPHLWSIKILPRTKFFLWLAARNRILTAELLAKRGWIGPSICVLCSSDTKRLEHFSNAPTLGSFGAGFCMATIKHFRHY